MVKNKDKIDYSLWINQESVKKKFDKDFKKKKISIHIPSLFIESFVLLFFSIIFIILIKPSLGIIYILLGLSSCFIFINLCLMFWSDNTSLTPKDYLVYSFYILSKEIKEKEDSEQKRIENLIRVLIHLIDKSQIEKASYLFNYNKTITLKKDLINFITYLDNKFKDNELDNLNNLLSNLSKKIYEEKLEGPFIEKLLKLYPGDLNKRPTIIFHFFKKNNKKIWALILILALIIVGLVLKIPIDNLFGVIGGGIVVGIILWLITSQKQ